MLRSFIGVLGANCSPVGSVFCVSTSGPAFTAVDFASAVFSVKLTKANQNFLMLIRHFSQHLRVQFQLFVRFTRRFEFDLALGVLK